MHPQDNTDLILVTTYTNPECLAHTPKMGNGKGIYAFDLCTHTGKMTQRGEPVEVRPNPAFLLKHPTLPIIYGSTERIDAPGEIFTLEIDSNTDAGVRMSNAPRRQAGGRSTCYINISDDRRTMTTVNYWDAKVCSMEMTPEGDVSEVATTIAMPGSEYVDTHNPDRTEHWQYRQRWPHTHCAVTEPYTGKGVMFVCDLGRDCIVQLEAGPSGLVNVGEVMLAAGLGPRHCIFHPRVQACFVVNELTSSVSSFRFNPEGARSGSGEAGCILEHMQTISTLPVDWQDKQTIKNGVWKAASHCSEIRIHPSGKLLFIGNRGHDSLAIYHICQQTGELTLASIPSTNGACPRNYNFSREGKWVIAGNQDSGELCVFECDVQQGTLKMAHTVECPAPNFVYNVPRTASQFA